MKKAFSAFREINMLHLPLAILFLIVFGGCQMQETTAQTDAAQKIVLEHAAKNYSLPPADVKVSDVTPKNFFPEVKRYYLEQNKSQHLNYNYLVYKNQAYSSGIDGDLRRFLKDYDFVRKTGDVDEYLTLLRIFSLPKNINVIDAEYIGNHQKELQSYAQVQPPKLVKNNDGSAEISFYTTPVVPFRPEKWTAKINSNSEVQIGK